MPPARLISYKPRWPGSFREPSGPFGRSPLGAMAESFLYLTTTGRVSGKPREIEIWFVEHRGCYYMVSERLDRSNWVKNLLQDPNVGFNIGTREKREADRAHGPAVARVVHRDKEPDLSHTISALMDEKYGWSDGLIVELSAKTGNRSSG